jgi:hypothetical protein
MPILRVSLPGVLDELSMRTSKTRYLNRDVKLLATHVKRFLAGNRQ